MQRLVAAALVLAALTGCAAHELSENERSELLTEAGLAISDFKDEDPDIGKWFTDSYGYAVFPSIGKGGIGIGGAYGEGLVYQNGYAIGNSTMTQATIGLQLGGQSYQEVIFFKDKDALENFTSGNFEFGAQVSAVALTAGASADADFQDGMAIFTIQNGGLMYEASVGGQKFSYRAFE